MIGLHKIISILVADSDSLAGFDEATSYVAKVHMARD